MARNFRIFEKKRGNRRTGSRKLGAAGEALFFAVFLLLGCAGLAALVTTLVIPEWRVNHEFLPHSCTVLQTRSASILREGSTLYRPEIEIQYQIGDESYVVRTYDIQTVRGSGYSADETATQQILGHFRPGQQLVCWYDPLSPGTAVLVRGSQWWVWLTFLVPTSFIIIGGGGLAWSALSWGKSEERRAALVQRANSLDLFDPDGRAGNDYPNIPSGANITNSPGTRLRFRLPVAVSPALALSTVLVACLLWNGIVGVAAVLAIRSHLDGRPDWLLTACVIPFALAGLALIGFFVRQLLMATGIGRTLVEISDHPLHPGRNYGVFVSHTGRLQVNQLEMLLVCDEEATFRHGTNTRTETRRVYQQPVLLQSDLEMHPGMPFEATCDVAIPADAMHSFKADHNEVNWKLIVKGAIAGWPDYERSFPLIVQPGSNGTSSA